jgi:hypothetical protein
MGGRKIDWGKHNKTTKAQKNGTEHFNSGHSKVLYGDQAKNSGAFTPAKASLITAEIIALKDVQILTVKYRQDLKRFLLDAEDQDRLNGLKVIFDCTGLDDAKFIDRAFQHALKQNLSLNDVFSMHKKTEPRT